MLRQYPSQQLHLQRMCIYDQLIQEIRYHHRYQGRDEEEEKIVTVVYGRETFELVSTGYAVANGQKTAASTKTVSSRSENLETGESRLLFYLFYPSYFFNNIQGSGAPTSSYPTPFYMSSLNCIL